MNLRVPLGIDDYRVLREKRCEYVDKTHLITDLIDRDNIKVIILPRPRRFGKTINLSMLRWYWEKRDENLWPLFEGLAVSRAGESYRAHFQQYPVILISFKGTKADAFIDCQRAIRAMLQRMYAEHRTVIEGKLDSWKQRDFDAILSGTADEALYRRSLLNLTEYLHEVTGKRTIVLIDEYDAPIHAGYAHGYYAEIIDFFRQFMESSLKDNPHLERAVLTGILRVSRESIFSGLNNALVYTLLDEEFNTCFGFTDAEVSALLAKAEMPELIEAVRSYYNGYEFGGEAIYNPWSILYFLNSQTKQLQPFWANTSSNDLVKDLLQHHAFAVEADVRTLLEGGSIAKRIDTNVVFPELRENESVLWSILVFTGYLKAARGPIIIGQPPPPYQLSIPNLEVAEVYRTTFEAWLKKGLQAQGGALTKMLDGLLHGDDEKFETQLQMFAATIPSYHDANGADPEQFYHGLMIGLLATLEPDHEVRSNRESGTGRPDVMIRPRHPGKPGVVLELKSARRKQRTIARALQEGHEQFAQHNYAGELRASGVETVHSLVVAFDGKRVKVEVAKAPAKKKAIAARKAGASGKKSPPKTPRKR